MKIITLCTFAVLAGIVIAPGLTRADEPVARTNQPMPLAVPLTRQQFVTDAAMAGMVEVYVSRLALEKSTNVDVRNFANRIVKDHSAANQRLEKIAKEEKLDFPSRNMFGPDDLNWNNPMVTRPEETKGAQLLTITNESEMAGYRAIRFLKSLNGVEFDQAYWNSMAADHLLVVNEFELASKNLADPKLKTFAEKNLPALRNHLKIANRFKNDRSVDATHGHPSVRTNQMIPERPFLNPP